MALGVNATRRRGLGIADLNGALDLVSSLSVGALVMLLALGLPILCCFADDAAQPEAALIGAGQLRFIVAVGGFTPLNWDCSR